MNLIEINTKQAKKEFLKVPLAIYKNDKNWIRPLDRDIENVFDLKKNKYFLHGEATRWLLKDEKGNLIGRIAAFINKKNTDANNQPTGGIGFFECINNKDAAFLLFDACKQWLQQRGMEAMDGPINFGEKDRWWGLLVDGFFEPVYGMSYNPPYYHEFFEAYGFEIYYQQFYYLYKVHWEVPGKYREKSDRIAKNPDYHSEHLRKKNLEKYMNDFRNVYNKAWGKHPGFKEISKEQAWAIMCSIKPIMDENIIWFTYYKEEPIAFFIMLPEINQIFKHINNGKLGLLEKILFVWYRWRGVCRKMYSVVFGVVPRFQGRGVEGHLIMAAARHIQSMNKYDDFEMTWVGDFNTRVIHLVESLGAQKIRTGIVYRKLFDETKLFTRAPMMD
ncbi:MAG: hypothetical protein V1781_03695 [Bacteroidota bacterium]